LKVLEESLNLILINGQEPCVHEVVMVMHIKWLLSLFFCSVGSVLRNAASDFAVFFCKMVHSVLCFKWCLMRLLQCCMVVVLADTSR